MDFKYLYIDVFRIDRTFNHYTGVHIMIVFIIFILIQPPLVCLNHVLCPPYYPYLESGNDCVFILETCGNSSHAEEQCLVKGASLVSMIYNVTHFNDLCKFAKKRLPDPSSFYLGAYRDEDKFLWNMNNDEVSFLQPLATNDSEQDCLEMVVSDYHCYLNAASCDKQTLPVCEFAHANPCVYNNGGCEGECVPRHAGDRKCVCLPGLIAIGTRCIYTKIKNVEFVCQVPAIYSPENNVCLLPESMNNELNHVEQLAKCKNSYGREMMNPPNNRTKFNQYCAAIRTQYDVSLTVLFHLNGWYDSPSKTICWDKTNPSNMDPWCSTDLTDKYERLSNPQICDPMLNRSGGLLLKVNVRECCYHIKARGTYTAKALCAFQSPNECIDPHWFRNCPINSYCEPFSGFRQYQCKCKPGYDMINGKCEDTDECRVHNGGCFHICENTIGSRKCSCNQGYYIFRETECRYNDRCMVDVEGKGCPNVIRFLGCEKIEIKTDVGAGMTQVKVVNMISRGLIFMFIILGFIIFSIICFWNKFTI